MNIVSKMVVGVFLNPRVELNLFTCIHACFFRLVSLDTLICVYGIGRVYLSKTNKEKSSWAWVIILPHLIKDCMICIFETIFEIQLNEGKKINIYCFPLPQGLKSCRAGRIV